MATIKEIKRRRSSIESTKQITKAMKLVATVKLQHTKERAQNSIPYFDTMYSTVSDIIKKSQNVKNEYITSKEGGKKALIVISANRGLAGGYNSNIIKELIGIDSKFDFNEQNTLVYSIGSKVRDALKRKGFTIENDFSECIENPNFKDVSRISSIILNDFKAGKISEIYLTYTLFKNTVVHIPRTLKLLPIENTDHDMNEGLKQKKGFDMYVSEYANDDKLIMNYEPQDDEIISLIVPKYINSLIFGAMTASVASENGARMTAMDSATNNANELIDKLSIQFNRARQGAITQELTEIIAGANAI